MAQTLIGADQSGAREAAGHVVVVEHQHVEENLKVRRGPPALHIHLGKADLAVAGEAREKFGIDHLENSMGARLGPSDTKGAPIGQHHVHGPDLEPLHDGKECLEPARQALLSGNARQHHGHLPRPQAECRPRPAHSTPRREI